MHQHPGKQWAGRRDGRRREADGRAQRQRGLHQGRAAALRLRRRRRRRTGRTPGAACAELRKDGISMWLKIAEIVLLAALAADLLSLLILCAKKKAAEKEIKEMLGEEGFQQYILEIEQEKKIKRNKNARKILGNGDQ